MTPAISPGLCRVSCGRPAPRVPTVAPRVTCLCVEGVTCSLRCQSSIGGAFQLLEGARRTSSWDHRQPVLGWVGHSQGPGSLLSAGTSPIETVGSGHYLRQALNAKFPLKKYLKYFET